MNDVRTNVTAASSTLLLLMLVKIVFFFNDTATTEIYTLSLHDALPISCSMRSWPTCPSLAKQLVSKANPRDRKSTRLNSSHSSISYAVFCLKKKNMQKKTDTFYSLTNKHSTISARMYRPSHSHLLHSTL